MRPGVRGGSRHRGRILPLLGVALVLLFFTPYIGTMLASAPAASPAVSPNLVTSVSADVFWNGVNVNKAPNPASALGWSFANVARVHYDWNGPLIGPGVSQAFLVVLFLGLPAYTKQQVQSIALPIGSINMTYDLTEFKWYLQGLFELHAYLENPNGSQVWSENFYVRVAQPYDLVVTTIGLLIIAVLELYLIATVGPRAADKPRKSTVDATPVERPNPPGNG